MKNQVIAIIPARFASTRFPEKMLYPIMGKSVLQRTYEQAKKCKMLDEIIIATDHERIFDHAKAFGARVCLTSPSSPTGSDRIIEVLENEKDLADANIVVNVQGDEPCIPVTTIEKVIIPLKNDSSQILVTAAVPISDETEVMSPSTVKVVCDKMGHALYFSRAPIPGIKPKGSHTPSYLKHLGIYAFRKDFLIQYGKLPKTPLQQVEDLEQLKVLESGYKIKVELVDQCTPQVDIPEDIQRVEAWLTTQNISL